MKFSFENALAMGTDLGKDYLKKEIADHGRKKPKTRPDTLQVPSGKVEEKKGMSTKTMVVIGGGVLVGVAILALLLKK